MLTAGHCVVDPESGVDGHELGLRPGVRATGVAPYGLFPATHLATTAGWRTQQDFDVDLAFADVARNAAGAAARGRRRRSADRVRRRRADGPPHAFGYPAAPPWTGERLVAAPERSGADTTPSPSPDQGLACTMTGGSSGGPWLRASTGAPAGDA